MRSNTAAALVYLLFVASPLIVAAEKAAQLHGPESAPVHVAEVQR